MARFADVFGPKNQKIVGTFTAGSLEVSYDSDSASTITVTDASHTTITSGESGDLTLDAGDDVILDSHVGKWRFKRNGTLTNMVSTTSADGSKMVFDNQISDAGYDFKCSDGGVGITALAIDAANAGLVKLNSSLSMKEASAAQADTAAYGQLWVKTATPNQLYFTTDAGDDIQITSGTAMAFVGDITGVTAGVGLSGGGTSGALTLTLDLSELSDVTPADGDKLATLDSDGANEQLTTVASLATLFAGTGLTASSSVIGVDASQTQITAVGTIGTGVWQGTAIASSYIAADAITGAKIADDAINSEHYTDGSIDTAHIADDQVTLAKMAGLVRGKIIVGDASGNPSALAAGANGKLLVADANGDPSWTTVSGDIGLSAGAMTIQTGAVEHAMLAGDCIDGDNIQDDVINSEHYADGSIDTAHIADNQVTLAKMAGLTRGSIIVGNASGDPAALTIGSNTYVLKSDGTDIAWAAASSGAAADDHNTVLHMQVFS